MNKKLDIDVLDILKSWITSVNPTETQSELAKKRLDVCAICDFKREVIHNKEWSWLCGRCGCPIRKKIYTDQYGSCPLKKWNFIEDDYIKDLKVKEKSII